ncbi:endopeptidase La [Alphaproteobacteria bacterium]|nr:endopeptidase La [Alphaproteobacteria bacterium]
MSEIEENQVIPILPLRDIVVFPHMIVPLFVGREKSVRALEAVMEQNKQILLLTQTEAGTEDPAEDDVYRVGTLGSILQLLKLPDGTVKVLVEGTCRAQVNKIDNSGEFLLASTVEIKESKVSDSEVIALGRAAVHHFEDYIKLNKKIAAEVLTSVKQLEDTNKIADILASHIAVNIEDKQQLLEKLDVRQRLEKLYELMDGEISVLQVERRIRSRVKRQMEKTQREYYLNEQMKAIQKELGETEDGRNEIDEIEEKIAKARMPKEAKEKAITELKKLRNMGPMSAEATVVRNYLDWMVALPWKKSSKLKIDLDEARQILDDDHHGLDKVKERIIEFLAVQQRTKKNKGPILCLVGPPGVGKTSLGKSIARASGRQFVRMALGGVRDEAEIRGHRRTYIGSLPGKIIHGMKKAEKNNPLFLLDEIDKLGADWRGDPSSALLEVLDPAQNNSFQDHYLEVDFDLSNVLFITTANSLNMPEPLLDRMEIIQLSGYTEDEKIAIALNHLLPRQIADHGVKHGEIEVSEDAIRDIIRYYTREAGVRALERSLARVVRKALTKIISGQEKILSVSADNLSQFMGVRKFKFGEIDATDQVGVVTGLAWTQVGGELLQVESVRVPGKGKVSSTGKLGDVMKESIQAADFYVKSRAKELGIDLSIAEKHDIHLHVPEGATPKDGPSAGVAMATSIISSHLGLAVKKDVAMTGEITLRGQVLPIGGLKEKLLAALRGGIKTVIIPKDNEKDLEEIPENVKAGLKIMPVTLVDEVINIAFSEPLKPLIEDIASAIANESKTGGDIVAH